MTRKRTITDKDNSHRSHRQTRIRTRTRQVPLLDPCSSVRSVADSPLTLQRLWSDVANEFQVRQRLEFLDGQASNDQFQRLGIEHNSNPNSLSFPKFSSYLSFSQTCTSAFPSRTN